MSKLKVVWTSQFKKDYKAAMKSHLNMDLLDDVIRSLANQEELDPKYKGHPLSGNWKSFMECHIRPDWLLIYKIANDELILTLARTGSHSNLFGKQGVYFGKCLFSFGLNLILCINVFKIPECIGFITSGT